MSHDIERRAIAATRRYERCRASIALELAIDFYLEQHGREETVNVSAPMPITFTTTPNQLEELP